MAAPETPEWLFPHCQGIEDTKQRQKALSVLVAWPRTEQWGFSSRALQLCPALQDGCAQELLPVCDTAPLWSHTPFGAGILLTRTQTPLFR